MRLAEEGNPTAAGKLWPAPAVSAQVLRVHRLRARVGRHEAGQGDTAGERHRQCGGEQPATHCAQPRLLWANETAARIGP